MGGSPEGAGGLTRDGALRIQPPPQPSPDFGGGSNPPPTGVGGSPEGAGGLSPLDAIIAADVPTEIRNLPWRMGVDVARYGADKSVICLRRGHRVERLIAFEKIDTMRLADEIRDIAETLGVPAVFVDETGVGGGVVDRLKQLRVPVFGVEGGGKANRSSQFENLRAETFWEVARRLREREMSLPPDNELAAQLLAMRYEVSSAERIRLDSKPQLRRKGVASPDRADALALAFMEPPPSKSGCSGAKRAARNPPPTGVGGSPEGAGGLAPEGRIPPPPPKTGEGRGEGVRGPSFLRRQESRPRLPQVWGAAPKGRGAWRPKGASGSPPEDGGGLGRGRRAQRPHPPRRKPARLGVTSRQPDESDERKEP